MRGDIGRLRHLFGDRRGAISVLAAFVIVGTNVPACIVALGRSCTGITERDIGAT